MPTPGDPDARLYHRCAINRFDDAEVLLKANHTTGAVYLAGYGIECILKALALMAVSPARRSLMLHAFRGARGHDYEWLRTQYLQNGGSGLPPSINNNFIHVNDWSTDLRYAPRTMKDEEAEDFLTAARNIIHWADGRLG